MSALSFNLRPSKPVGASMVHCFVVDGAIFGLFIYVNSRESDGKRKKIAEV